MKDAEDHPRRSVRGVVWIGVLAETLGLRGTTRNRSGHMPYFDRGLAV